MPLSTVSTPNAGLEKSPRHTQNTVEKEIPKPEKVQPHNNNNYLNDIAVKNTNKNTLVEEKKPTTDENGQHIIVKKGDTLEKILLKAYGQYDKSRISLVLDANPEISNVNAIFVGQLIRLPAP